MSLEKFLEIFMFSSLILIVLGILGNILMLFVFSKQPLKRLSISVYFRVMAIVNLLISINWAKVFLVEQYGFNLSDQSTFLCKTTYYFVYCCRPISAWILVVAGIDRFVSIFCYTRFSFIRKFSFQIGIVVAISVYNVAFYFHLLFNENLESTALNGSNSTKVTCTSSIIRFIFMSDLINTAILPFLIMLASSLAIMVVLISARRRARSYVKPGLTKTQSRDIKFAITMIVLNLYFFLSNAPNPLYNFLLFSNSMEANTRRILRICFVCLYYSYYCLNFYVQLLVNSLMRRETLQLFKRRNTSFYKSESTANKF